METVMVLSQVSMTIEEEYARFNVQEDRRFFDRESVDTTMDGWIWLDSMVQIVSIRTQPVHGAFHGWFCLRSE